MKVLANSILPSQNFLKEGTLAFIDKCIKSGDLDNLPSKPIVRKNYDGELIAIDGHNLIAYMAHSDEFVDVHIAQSADDGLPLISEANIERNKDLRNKFGSVVSDQKKVANEGIRSFSDLIERFPELFI